MKCLEKRQADRWQNVGELLTALEASEEAQTPAPVETAHELIESRFKLTERICRKLNRAILDPRIIGDHLYYADNQVRLDILVFFLHGLGLDHGDFEPILKRLSYRGVSPTLYGCEPERRAHFFVACRPCDHLTRMAARAGRTTSTEDDRDGWILAGRGHGI
jgi:hypothetical protein